MTILRFAPSPNGRLHLGHAYSALVNASLAATLGGRLLLRIEDIDPTRCTEEFTAFIYEDLHWLGIIWEEPVRVQSQHMKDYAAALAKLKERGLIYPCFCSRSTIAAQVTGRDPDGAPLYPGTCRNLHAIEKKLRLTRGDAHCWRMDMQKALTACPAPHHYTRFDMPSMEAVIITAHPELWGDIILARKETPTSYHLSVVVDDALQHITHVVRGADLEAATCIHVLLQKLLGLATPLYHHHQLLVTPDGDKLAKSRKSETLAELRDRGLNQQDVLQMLPL